MVMSWPGIIHTSRHTVECKTSVKHQDRRIFYTQLTEQIGTKDETDKQPVLKYRILFSLFTAALLRSI